jgi:transketolase
VSAAESMQAAERATGPQLFDCRDAYIQALEEMAGADSRVCAVANDSVSSAKMKTFRAKFPDRFVNVGIAEQNMVGVGSGLANGGMVPYVCGAGCFLTARAMEQLKVDLAYSKSNVKICAMSPGMAYGQLGPTHHSIEDLAWTRVLPNLAVVIPADPVETDAVMRYSLTHDGPMYLRISRMPVPRIHGDNYGYRFGKAVLLREGTDITLIASGVLVSRALDAAGTLAKNGISARVLNMSTVKPLDRGAIVDAARSTRGIVTVEEAFATGGLGGAVAEVVVQEHPAPMRILGVPDTFAPTGSAEFLLEHFGLTAAGIERAAMDLLKNEE